MESSRELFITTIKDELPRFDRVFCAIPESKTDWRPHENSRSALEIMKTMISDALSFPIFLEKGTMDSSDFVLSKSINPIDLGFEFKEVMNATLKIVDKMSNKAWDERAVMTDNDKMVWETTKGQMAWSILLDQIHHRGQLSVYIRPMGGKVPAIYGPSGDSEK